MEQQQKISLNVHLQVPNTPGVSTTQDGSHTPNTPEILNTIVNMTAGPFAPPDFFPNPASSTVVTPVSETGATGVTGVTTTPMTIEQMLTSPMDSAPPMYTTAQESPSYTDMSMDTSPTPSSNLSSPTGTPGSSMSVQAIHSQFIKEGLKFKMRQRIGSGSQPPSEAGSSLSVPSPVDEKPPKIKRIKLENLTPDDQVRRQRRRERNKVAATKCRNKKKARTVNLIKESESLDTQNKALKIEISKLESEKERLIGILETHEPSCAKKLKQVMKSRHPSGGYDYYSGPQSTTTNPEFRTPLPPIQTSRIPSVKITPPDNDPPTFAEAIRMVTEVKEEEEEEISAYNLQGYFNSEDFYQANSFLGKRNLGQTYLDLDSRCIAL